MPLHKPPVTGSMRSSPQNSLRHKLLAALLAGVFEFACAQSSPSPSLLPSEGLSAWTLQVPRSCEHPMRLSSGANPEKIGNKLEVELSESVHSLDVLKKHLPESAEVSLNDLEGRQLAEVKLPGASPERICQVAAQLVTQEVVTQVSVETIGARAKGVLSHQTQVAVIKDYNGDLTQQGHLKIEPVLGPEGSTEPHVFILTSPAKEPFAAIRLCESLRSDPGVLACTPIVARTVNH